MKQSQHYLNLFQCDMCSLQAMTFAAYFVYIYVDKKVQAKCSTSMITKKKDEQKQTIPKQ
ncbi:CLUMA_CG004576, isoform A [Clunio marinus]|uniref:CLUMA_CG004576, isoform A n=1 Tax=Clunio marinus TaxID=568069 RepID=A0A1J1HWI7_9DIPT|nr:CLUMA_CG004576, isoform A [Clunio marinus]